MWWNRRGGFRTLAALALGCGVFFQLAASHISSHDALDALGYFPMGLSLFLTFAFCSFTEPDRRGRFEGFPSRFFTLPVATRTLVVAPVFFGVAAVLTVYAAWSQVVLPRAGRHLPFAWPCGYLAAGMICYQAILWVLARFRIARLFALGIGGALFATAWTVFQQDFERDVLSRVIIAGVPARTFLCSLLATLAAVSLVAAYWVVESERRGGSREWQGWRRLLDFAMDALPRWKRRFASPGSAQFWFEWRRHGTVLPASTAGVLLVIMLPAVFARPLSAERTALCLPFILLTPLLLAFPLGKGFGKADLWAKNSTLSLFQATRPLPKADRIAAKMKAAALAAIASWAVVSLLTPLWLRLCCDDRIVVQFLQQIAGIFPGIGARGTLVILGLVAALVTWRLLAGSLYLGMSGRNWMLTLAAVGVFAAFFAGIFILAVLSNRPEAMEFLLNPPFKWAWMLAALFGLKLAGAGRFAVAGCRRGLITRSAVVRYFGVWILATAALVAAVWMSAAGDGPLREILIWVALLAVPLLRVSLAPLALAWGRAR
jgi:hypothetical protein